MVATKIILDWGRNALKLSLVVVLLSLAVVLVLGKVPVGIEYGSPYRGMPDAATNGIDIVSAARGQIGVTVAYDPAYRNIPYPNGDVPMDRGVCSDVIVRALRTARGVDLQRLVHEDMKAHFIMYPSLIRWQMLGPDPNIDHRRVLNLERFFGRSGWSLEVTNEKDCYFPGDIVTCLIGGEIPHGMIVSDRKSPDGVPLVIHNVGSGTQEEDRLFSYEITGHHRVISCVAANDIDAAAVDNCLSNVCSLVSSAVSALPDGRCGTPEYIREFGVPLRRCPSYQDLVGLVSSNQEAVCTNFSMCATNELSRIASKKGRTFL